MAPLNAFDVMMKQKKTAIPLQSAFRMTDLPRKRGRVSSVHPRGEDKLQMETPRKKPKQQQQLFLDLGQKDIGQRTCEKCGLLYMRGVESDEKAHAQYCRKMEQGIQIVGWKHERVHQTIENESARVIEIRGDDPSPHVKKLLEIKSILDDALGLVDESVFLQQKHFVYLHQNRVVGVVSAEAVSTGYEMQCSDIVSIDRTSKTKDCQNTRGCDATQV
ncbi:hypothetical protein Ae201684P_010301 [Aphanomyces euteiches]|nr:hypothetical protein Ae201684P_010301 [Aphanomyces euteiches]